MKDLRDDILKVSNAKPVISRQQIPRSKEIILIGTLDNDPHIEELILKGKLDVSKIKDRWESYLLQVVQEPFPGVDKALVITGSDMRGTIYGIYDLSAQIGVSPLYWWADVPVESHDEIYVLPGTDITDKPAVKYRGIFINDEAPALSGWAHEKFGGFNHHFYEHVFELILRMI